MKAVQSWQTKTSNIIDTGAAVKRTPRIMSEGQTLHLTL